MRRKPGGAGFRCPLHCSPYVEPGKGYLLDIIGTHAAKHQEKVSKNGQMGAHRHVENYVEAVEVDVEVWAGGLENALC